MLSSESGRTYSWHRSLLQKLGRKLSPFTASSLSGLLISLVFETIFAASPGLAADRIAFRYSIFERSLSVEDLRTYAETHQASPALKDLLGFLDSKQRGAVEEIIQLRLPLNVVTVDKVLDTELGQKILSEVDKVTMRRDNAGNIALRGASILSTVSPKGFSLVSFLEAYPSQELTIDVSQVPELVSFIFGNSSQTSHPANSTLTKNLFSDNLSSAPWWQLAVRYQTIDTQGKKIYGCLFGDSISSGLTNTLGNQIYNFALPGMSSVSLVEQLKSLNSGNLKCQKAVVAIGTNDALYGTSDSVFVNKMTEILTLVQSLGAKQIVLIPAFYSTVAASQEPSLAGTIPRVEEINTLIRQVAAAQNIPVDGADIQALYQDRALKQNLTYDGVHLNRAGIEIYEQALIKIFNSTPQSSL